MDRQKRVQDAGVSNESLIDTGKFQEAWVRISWWYWQARGAQAPPTLETLDELLTDREEFYRCRRPEGFLMSNFRTKIGTLNPSGRLHL